MTTLEKIVSHSMFLPSYELSRRVARLYPNDYILETEHRAFQLREYVRDGFCTVTLRKDLHCQFSTDWYAEEGGVIEPRNGFFDVEWRGCRMRVLRITRIAGDCEAVRHWIISRDEDEVKAFFADVCSRFSQVRDEVVMFSRGIWQKNPKLTRAIKATHLDDLVLPAELRSTLVEDVLGFFDAKETYARYGIAWKRGVLLLGPPGNGKTHMLKALVNEAKRPCLYVRSLKAVQSNPDELIGKIFAYARTLSPCILVFEDLDSMVTPENLSVFLNEMDGFAPNEGVLVLATTNYPEKLDPALIERPSRFDRKFTFGLPAHPERERFFAKRNEMFDPEMKMDEANFAEFAEATDGFSFAYLKELCVSATMKWMQARKAGSMDAVLRDQIALLRSQMKSA